VARRNPDLREARRRPGPGTKGWDVAWNALAWPLLAAVAVVAGLDFRAGGATLPAWAWPAGLAVLAAGLVLSARAMAVNPFFEGTVRIQRERGQVVVEAGPYRLVRHPGYLGMTTSMLGAVFVLDCLYGLFFFALYLVLIVARITLEDRTLQEELPGYKEYAGTTRYRLVPGVW
jgi:protein-S-isoprenylcysteine O-methyltransferase Ste14